jgi:hypothetical protein
MFPRHHIKLANCALSQERAQLLFSFYISEQKAQSVLCQQQTNKKLE